jgi:uncharacterized protein (UPF0332 family)
MKESTWQECIEVCAAIEISPDKAKAKSLAQIAQGRMNYLKNQKKDETNSNYIFEGYYTSITELVHALLSLKGYKVTNHLCLGYFLRDIVQRDDLFRKFDDARIKRNSLVYYGRTMDITTANTMIENIISLIKDIEKKVNDELKEKTMIKIP